MRTATRKILRNLCSATALAIGVFGCSDQASDKRVSDVSGDKEPTISTPESSEESTLTPKERRAFDDLTTRTGARFTIGRDTAHKTISSLTTFRGHGPRLVRRATTADASRLTQPTLALLAEYKDLFGMKDPPKELELRRVQGQAVDENNVVDELGMQHVRFSQVERGIPVVGAEMAAHYDVEGRLTAIQGRYVPDLANLTITPTITSSQAETFARADDPTNVTARLARHVRRKSITTTTTKLEPVATHPARLVIYSGKLFAATTEGPALAWEMLMREGNGPRYWRMTIDAHTGAVLHRVDMLESIRGSGVGVKGDTKTLEVSQTDDGETFFLLDPTRNAKLWVLDLELGDDLQKAVVVTSQTTTTWDTTGAGRGSAVDAHANTGLVYDYYQSKLGRKAWDDQDSQIVSLVHDGADPDNASFSPIEKVMRYGDGDVFFSAPAAGCLDVIAHEYTHAITDNTSALVYDGQSGALNEAISDIFGAIVEHEVKPDPATNWLVGEGFIIGDKSLRDMANPGSVKLFPQPSHMKELVNTQQDNGGVHTNSGIVNKAAHLMTVGGTHPLSKITVSNPIGWLKLAQLFYRANQRYFVATSDFALAAKGTMEAAKDLKFTETELNTIDCAWKAVGVVKGDCAAVTPKTTPPPVSDATEEETPAAEEEEEEPKPKKTTAAPTTRTTTGCSAALGDASAPSTLALVVVVGLLVAARRARPRKNVA